MAFPARSSLKGHPGLSRFTGHFPGPDHVSEAIPAYPNPTATSPAWSHP